MTYPAIDLMGAVTFALEQADKRRDALLAEHQRDAEALQLALEGPRNILIRMKARGLVGGHFLDRQSSRLCGMDVDDAIGWLCDLAATDWDTDDLEDSGNCDERRDG